MYRIVKHGLAYATATKDMDASMGNSNHDLGDDDLELNDDYYDDN